MIRLATANGLNIDDINDSNDTELAKAKATALAANMNAQLQSFVGNVPENMPKVSATWSYEHSFGLAGGGKLIPKLSGQYSTKYWSLDSLGQGVSNVAAVIAADSNQASPDYLAWQQAYAIWDAALAWENADGRATASAYVRNLNREIVMIGYAGDTVSLNAPMTWGATFTAKF